MAIEMNSSALNAYRQLNLENKNTMIKSTDQGIETAGTYKGALSALSRSKESKAENNYARTMLLKALGKAFNVKGMAENEDGTITFSKDFMTRLEKILGKDFKASDFGINANGEVTSGKPLTYRRVKAIIQKADFVGAGSFNIAVYERKLNHMMKRMGVEKWDLPKLEAEAKTNRKYQTIVYLIKTLDYLKIADNCSLQLAFDYQVAIEDHFVDFDDDQVPEPFDESSYTGPRYTHRDPITGETKTARSITGWANDVQLKTGLLIHTENAYTQRAPQKIDYLNSYTTETYKLYVKKTIDIFFACEEAGKLHEFESFLSMNPGTCVEGRIDELNKFESKHLIQKSADDIREAAEIQRIAQGIAEDGKAINTDTLIFAEINAIETKGDASPDATWEDYAPTVKQNLIGKTAVIMQPVAPTDEDGIYTFEPVMKEGQPEVRPLTAADIDTLGPICLQTLFG